MTAPDLSLRQEVPPQRARPATDQEWADLAETLAVESRLLSELRQVLMRQRAAVARGEVAAVDASVGAMGRLLPTIAAARQRRSSLLADLGVDKTSRLSQLDELFPEGLPDAMVAARAGLERVAADAAIEVHLNRDVLRRVMAAGDAYLQALFSGGAPEALYQREGRPAPGAPGVFVNREA